MYFHSLSNWKTTQKSTSHRPARVDQGGSQQQLGHTMPWNMGGVEPEAMSRDRESAGEPDTTGAKRGAGTLTIRGLGGAGQRLLLQLVKSR
jgi:hypothetical protein